MNAVQQALYQQLVAFEIDEPGVELRFVQRLAREQGWQPAYAGRVLVEYKRFLFLAMVAGHVVTPSEQVDQAWHLHLTYTRSYWERLCKEVLRRPLHHCPTQGGQAEQAKYIDLYEQTRASYRQYFGHAPPADIWPRAEERFGEDVQHVNVNIARHWIVPKPRWRWLKSRRHRWMSASAAGMAVAPLASVAWNPLDWQGRAFLGFYVLLLIGAAALAALVRWCFPPAGVPFTTKGKETLEPYEVACLVGGPIRAVHAALAAMVQAKTLIVSEQPTKWLGFLHASKKVIEPGEPLPKNSPKLEQAMYAAAAETPATARPLIAAGLPIAQEMEQELIERGLLLPRGGPGTGAIVASLIMVAPLVLGVAKVCLGVARERPVGILIMFCLVTLALAGAFLFIRSRFTAAGKRLYRGLRAQHGETRVMAQTATNSLSPWELAMAVGLFGMGTLSASAHANLRTLLPPAPGGYGGDGGGCGGGSGCGGGGCGGGGGGCGGCGS